MIVGFVDIGGIDDHHCLEVIFCFVDIGGIVDYHCLEMIVGFVDIGGIDDHHCSFRFVNKRVSYPFGIISIAHAPVNVTDFSIGSINCVRHFLQA